MTSPLCGLRGISIWTTVAPSTSTPYKSSPCSGTHSKMYIFEVMDPSLCRKFDSSDDGSDSSRCRPFSSSPIVRLSDMDSLGTAALRRARSQRQIIVLLRGYLHLLIPQHPERPCDPPPRRMRHDDVIDVATLCCD